MLTAMGVPPPRLSVVTVCRGNPIELGDTLSSIASQEAPVGGQAGAPWLEWVVVDGSDDASCQQLLAQHRQSLRSRGVDLHYLSRPARGIYAGVNAGLAASRGPWLQVLPAGAAVDQWLLISLKPGSAEWAEEALLGECDQLLHQAGLTP